MKFTIKQNLGLTELLIILPLFLGMLCMIAWIGFLLIAKSKMEKHAWVIQTKESHNMDIQATELNPQYEIHNNISIRQGLQIGSMFRSTIPTAFKVFLAAKVTKYKTLQWQGNFQMRFSKATTQLLRLQEGIETKTNPFPIFCPTRSIQN
ncbi:MAG: hypothetical protein R2877_07815 [Bdellovibrionota bacterium]